MSRSINGFFITIICVLIFRVGFFFIIFGKHVFLSYTSSIDGETALKIVLWFYIEAISDTILGCVLLYYISKHPVTADERKETTVV